MFGAISLFFLLMSLNTQMLVGWSRCGAEAEPNPWDPCGIAGAVLRFTRPVTEALESTHAVGLTCGNTTERKDYEKQQSH